MSGYDSLIGQAFRRRGTRWTILSCEGAAVLAVPDGTTAAAPVRVPLAEVLDTLEVPEITVTELPDSLDDRSRR